MKVGIARYVVAGLVLLLVVLWWTRWQVIEAPSNVGPAFYRISRLTGKTELVAISSGQGVVIVEARRPKVQIQQPKPSE